MSHVAPERWADAAAGRVSDGERAAMVRHADGCAACARARGRIERIAAPGGTLAQLAARPAPELGWDSIRARVHWDVSTERRSRPHGLRVIRPARVRPWMWIAGAALSAAAASVAIVAARGDSPSTVASGEPGTSTAALARPLATTPPVAPVVAAAPAAAGLVSRASGDVSVDGVHLGRDALFARTLQVGAELATGEGRVDVQLGAGTAASLGAHGRLRLRRVDAQAIELVVDGTVDVEVAPRAPGQRFLVIAGDRTVEVHGTEFRVRHDGSATAVACQHGLVSLRDGAGEVEVAAARRVEVSAEHAVGGAAPIALTAEELAQMAATAPVTTPTWGDAATALRASSTLEIATAGARAVRVDGVERGEAPLRLRVSPGRHLVEAADHAGRYRRVDWVEVGATPAVAQVPADKVEASPTAATTARQHELRAGIEGARKSLARCVRAITQAGLGDTYVQIEIAVDPSGALSYLNVVDTDLPSATAGCVRGALGEIRFAPGPTASWRERIDL